ncbi:hypothetical protein DRO64_04490 [Candidatus Bathyarchaeota archaeon]|nr:MAG: hypothetical protein DRO64_04490 [Candidatus Bathyarchaeota archaeon]
MDMNSFPTAALSMEGMKSTIVAGREDRVLLISTAVCREKIGFEAWSLKNVRSAGIHEPSTYYL